MSCGKGVKKGFSIIFLLTLAVFFTGTPKVEAVRIKDIAAIKGIRKNQLVGYGLVVGLNGTGDKSGAEFTVKSLANMMKRRGLEIDQSKLKVKNVAAVMVTAEMPAFARSGSRIDIVVSSLGDAKSLSGGTLLLTPLKGVDGQIYALAQGPLSIGGAGTGGKVKNHLLVARMAGGASVEREIRIKLKNKRRFTMALYNPDFTTAMRISDKINGTFGEKTAKPLDSGALELYLPSYMEGSVSEFLARVEKLTVTPDTPAKIVVNEKTGTVIIGENVSISTVAVSHGNLTITVTQNSEVSQPLPFSGGETVMTTKKNVNMTEEKARVMMLPMGSTLGELVKALNAIGATPRDMISIFQSIKAAGALQAELVVI